MNEVGTIYLYGLEGIEKDTNKAVEYFTKAIANKHDGAMCNLANYYTEFVKPPKLDFAYELYKEATKYENDVAFFNLGLFHHLGLATPRDHRKAFHYYEKSGELGNVDGKEKNNFLFFIFYFYFLFSSFYFLNSFVCFVYDVPNG
jgi:uncharacterized protein